MTVATVQLLADAPSQLLPAREQMAFTLMCHVILVPLGVAFPFITLVMNYIGLRRNDLVAFQLARRWSTVMAIQFAVGVITGTVLALEFGLLWPGLMGRWGEVFGIGFGVEAWAFFLEAILLSVYLYGWRRLKPRTHFLLGLPLPFLALLGAFGILSANAWMNTPRGFTLGPDGTPTGVDVRSVIFNPMFGPQYWHFIAAAYMTAAFMVAGVYAVGWLRGRRDRYHRLGFAVPFTVGAIVTPIQFVLGDAIARAVFHEQPVKFAAMEIVWKTDTDVPEYLFGRLNEDGTVSGGLKIPGLDSFLAGFSRDTEVQGLTSVPADERPTVLQANITHWAFDAMVGIGTLLLLLALWYGLAWLRHRDLPRSRWFFRAAAVAGVASVIAVEAGWVTAEVGRQPWVVYEYMRVAEAVTDIGASAIWTSFTVIVIAYALIAYGLLSVLLRLRLRWRRADSAAAAIGAPETEVPYGPRAPRSTASGRANRRPSRPPVGRSPSARGRRGDDCRRARGADHAGRHLGVRLWRGHRLRRRLLGPRRRRPGPGGPPAGTGRLRHGPRVGGQQRVAGFRPRADVDRLLARVRVGLLHHLGCDLPGKSGCSCAAPGSRSASPHGTWSGVAASAPSSASLRC